MTLEVVSPQDNLPVIRTLSELEVIVSQGLNTFVDVGNALGEIRRNKLYLPEYESFEDYLGRRWRFGYAYAGHQIVAADVFADISDLLDARFANVGQMLALGSVSDDREERRIVMELVLEATGGNPTASRIKSLAAALQEFVSTDGYITVDDSGTQKKFSKLSPEKKIAFLQTYLDRETWERQQQHIARSSLKTNLENPMVSKITLPSEQVNTLRSLAKYAPESEKDAYRTAWRDRL